MDLLMEAKPLVEKCRHMLIAPDAYDAGLVARAKAVVKTYEATQSEVWDEADALTASISAHRRGRGEGYPEPAEADAALVSTQQAAEDRLEAAVEELARYGKELRA